MGMRYRRIVASVGIGFAVASGALIGVSTAGAQAQDAVVRAAHFSPTTPGVDVYLAPFSGAAKAKLWLSSVTYGAVSPYARLTPGLYTIALRLHGKSASTPPALSWTLRAVAGQAYTVAGVGAGTAVRGVVIRDDLSAPSSGTGRVRVIQAASRAPHLTVKAKGGPVVAKNAAFATTTPYATVKSGSWSVDATASGASVRTTGTINVASGTVTSILALDAKGSGITIRTVMDSIGTSSVPRGPVSAGGGGTANMIKLFGDDKAPAPLPLVALTVALSAATVAAMYRLSRARA
jgi:Domain of unknown function (DUF4397)